MREKTRDHKEVVQGDDGKTSGGSEQISATGDAVIIADALYHIGDGLESIAKAINKLADAQGFEDPSEEPLPTEM